MIEIPESIDLDLMAFDIADRIGDCAEYKDLDLPESMIRQALPAFLTTVLALTASDVATVHTKVTDIEVCAIPEGVRNRYVFKLQVRRRGEQWAVMWDDHEWNTATQEWDYPQTADDDEWRAAHRFDLQVAMTIATEQCHKLQVGELTPAMVIAQDAGRNR